MYPYVTGKHFELIIDSTDMSYYGSMPCPPADIDKNEQFERYNFYFYSREENDEFMNIIYDLNDYCGAILDDSDVDYFSDMKLIKLNEWVNKKIPHIESENMKKIFSVLLMYTERAIKLGTVVNIQA